MNATDIIGYSYEADHHCVECAQVRFGSPVPDDAEDEEGNPVHPIFAGDEFEEPPVCGDCGEALFD